MKKESEDKIETNKTKSEEELIAEAYRKLIKHNISINSERDQLRDNAIIIGEVLTEQVQYIALKYEVCTPFESIFIREEDVKEYKEINFYFRIGNYKARKHVKQTSSGKFGFWIVKSFVKPNDEVEEVYYSFGDVSLDVVEQGMYYITDFLTDYMSVIVEQKERSVRGARMRSEKIREILKEINSVTTLPELSEEN